MGRRAYADVANEMQKHGRLFYPADKQLQFAQMSYNLLSESALPLTEIPGALQTLSDKGVKPLPLAMAHFGALQRNHWRWRTKKRPDNEVSSESQLCD